MCTPTSLDGIHEISPAPPRAMALASACPVPPSERLSRLVDPPVDHSPDVSPVGPGVDPSLALSDHAPCLVGGIITLDDASFTTKITLMCANDLPVLGCVALLHTGHSQTFIR